MVADDRFQTGILDMQHDVLEVFPWETEVDEEEVSFRFEDGVLTVGREGRKPCRRESFERLGEGTDSGRILDYGSIGRPCSESTTNAEVLRLIAESLMRVTSSRGMEPRVSETTYASGYPDR